MIKASTVVTVLFLLGLSISKLIPGRPALSSEAATVMAIVAAAAIVSAPRLRCKLSARRGQNSEFAGTLVQLLITEFAGVLGFVIMVVSESWWIGFGLLLISLLALLLTTTAGAGLSPAK